MKPEWLIRREAIDTVDAMQKDQCERAFRIFSITLILAHLQAFLHFSQNQALQLIRTLNLILAAVTDRSLTHEQLIERQVKQERPRTFRPRPLALRPAAPHLAPPA